jgi:hypothetical protein
MNERLRTRILWTGLLYALAGGVHADTLPTAIQFGDSVSKGYAATARADLFGKVDYRHDPWDKGDIRPSGSPDYGSAVTQAASNNGYSYTLMKSMRRQLKGKSYDVILFNSGLHDVQPYYRGHALVSPGQYRKFLEAIATDAEQHARIVIWVDTTEVPADLNKSAQQYGAPAHAQAPYNDIAHEIAREHGFYMLALSSDGQILHDVHYTAAGSTKQGHAVSACVLLALAGQQSDSCHK